MTRGTPLYTLDVRLTNSRLEKRGVDDELNCLGRRRMNNLFDSIPQDLREELTDVLVRGEHVRVERIVSQGHASPDDFWYDQHEHEWVIVLSGQAKLLIEGDSNELLLRPGDHINIPAHRKHRVAWTTPAEPTVWLAVFYHD